MPRQQRPARDRRQLTRATPARIPLVVATSSTSEGAATVEISFGIIAFPPASATENAVLQLNGIPQIRRQVTGTFPTAATEGAQPNKIVLTYASPVISDGEEFKIGPYDPAIRTSQGGFAAPVTLATVV